MGEARRKTFWELGCGRGCTAGSQAKGWEVCRVQQKRRVPELSWVSDYVAQWTPMAWG